MSKFMGFHSKFWLSTNSKNFTNSRKKCFPKGNAIFCWILLFQIYWVLPTFHFIIFSVEKFDFLFNFRKCFISLENLHSSNMFLSQEFMTFTQPKIRYSTKFKILSKSESNHFPEGNSTFYHKCAIWIAWPLWTFQYEFWVNNIFKIAMFRKCLISLENFNP